MKRVFIILLLFIFVFGCTNNNQQEVKHTVNALINLGPSVVKLVYNTPSGSDINENVSELINTSGYVNNPNQTLNIYFVNISSGHNAEFILIKKGDLDIVYDTGDPSSWQNVLNFLKQKGVDDIDLLIISQDQEGRSSNIASLANTYTIENVWYNGLDANYIDALKYNSNVKNVAYPYKEELDGITLQVLNPNLDENGQYIFSGQQNNGVVVLLKDRGTSVLLTGGILGGAQNYLANTLQENLKADILEIPDYGVGEGTADINKLILKTNPSIAIMTGSTEDPDNSRNAIINLLSIKGIKLYKTYEDGTIQIKIDGSGYNILTQNNVSE